ncbi:MAG: pentapeptide repeat-containing protein [bacterium]|nr:MAG: pentapeptide repeat-containing protein [bacterium]
MNKRIIKCFIVFFLLYFELGFAQGKNPTVYPYGGVPDSSRFIKGLMERIPLNFKKEVYFLLARFDSRADFGWAQFDSRADFEWAQFDSLEYFREAQFHSLADFGGAQQEG